MKPMHVAAAALAVVVVSSCGQPATSPADVPLAPAQRLEAILATPITFEQDSAYARFAAEQGGANLQRMLPALALDRSTSPLARANAVLRMGAVPILDFEVYARTIEDPDARVRGATLGVVGPLAGRAPAEAMPILARGLVDAEIGIQAKALQELRDRDLELLEFYIAGNPPAELRDIAIQAIRNAQAWGAPLTPGRDGTLRRITPSGVELVLEPDTTWAEWDLVIGTLSAILPDGRRRVLADSVEAVATIVPAVVDASGRRVALETARRIEVHDLESGEVRALGRGLAPRPLPFTPDFLYFREIGRMPAMSGAALRYELLRAGFAGAAPVPFDSVDVSARPGLRGYLSPLRWVRIHDRGTAFVLHTDGLPNHELPSPLDARMREQEDVP